jgi:hypothetical protein
MILCVIRITLTPNTGTSTTVAESSPYGSAINSGWHLVDFFVAGCSLSVF